MTRMHIEKTQVEYLCVNVSEDSEVGLSPRKMPTSGKSEIIAEVLEQE